MTIQIDENSGFCFGVTNAIKQAEAGLKEGPLYCLGDIVHNSEEVKRLSDLGLETIDYDDLRSMHHARVLFRAHGEPPSTYHIAEQNHINIIDASCPVVLGLQRRIREQYLRVRNTDAQIVIYGQQGHAEVIGLQGQTDNTAIVIESADDLSLLHFDRPIYLFSQTTKSVEGFRDIVARIRAVCTNTFEYHDTICRNVANRVENIRQFAAQNDIVFFVGGKKSSNAKVLFNHCLAANPRTFFISSAPFSLPEGVPFPLKEQSELSIGITGATSTPHWLMEQVCDYLLQIALND